MKTFNKILLIDDDVVSLFLTELTLKQFFNAEIKTVKTGEEAVVFLKEHCLVAGHACPTLIFLDLSLPGMDGFEFLDEFIHTDNFEKMIDIIVLTNSTYERDIELCRKYNIKAYVAKPLNYEKLEEMVAEWEAGPKEYL